eukprot:TRINITY_DN8461_c0_g2_i2.p1 TRINITY_DN8461_c0_g2~~TRINITY_DN8461_c0_g2_i2.p1  ORF type:complete len:183 (+),score=36.22 TRINITY_DN8461_c0_g2_i2:206-754(+)
MGMEASKGFPEYYYWPCFFTLQINNDTKDKQLKLWQELMCKYSEMHKVHAWGTTELFSSELCVNKEINRRLSRKDFDEILGYLVKSGFAAYTTSAKDKIFVYWKSVQEYAAAIYEWAQRTGRMNSVESIVDLSTSSENSKEIFYKVPVEIIKNACEALQRERKAEVFYSDATDEHGVKFFHM